MAAMEIGVDKVCQWKRCNVLRSKHVRLGLRIFESVDGPCGRAVITTADHFDLCGEHLDNVRIQYRDVIEYNLAHCPECGN